jgi:hypothetical protein
MEATKTIGAHRWWRAAMPESDGGDHESSGKWGQN